MIVLYLECLVMTSSGYVSERQLLQKILLLPPTKSLSVYSGSIIQRHILFVHWEVWRRQSRVHPGRVILKRLWLLLNDDRIYTFFFPYINADRHPNVEEPFKTLQIFYSIKKRSGSLPVYHLI